MIFTVAKQFVSSRIFEMIKPKPILLFVCSLFLSFPIQAADDCVADVTKYTQEHLKTRKPIFDAKGKNVEKIFPSKLDQYGFEDQVKLKDGTEVVYKTGGCVHYGYRFIFSGKDIKAVKPAEKLSRAELLLKNLELNQNEEKDLLLRALSEAKKKKKPSDLSTEPFYLPCGDATCELVDQGQQKVEIGYDFAL